LATVLVVGINYGPETTGNAPYTTAIAEHLAASGHATTVVTGFPHYPAWRIEPGEHRVRTTEVRNGVRILRRRHYVPASQSAIRRAAYEATFTMHGFLSRPERPDAVIGVIPSLGGGVLARLFAARARTAYGLIVQDLMGPAAAQSGIRGGRRVAGVTAAMERWATARARVVAIASESFRPYLLQHGVDDSRVMLLPNWTRIPAATGDRAVARARLGWPPDTAIVLHAGNMGLKQGLEQVVEAAQWAQRSQRAVRFVLVGDGSQRSALVDLAAGNDQIEILPFQPESDLPDILAAADVLLVSERETVIDMSLPSKLTTYFAAGRPVLAAVPAEGSTAAEIRRSGAGLIVPVGDPGALVEAVAHLVSDGTTGEDLGRAGRLYALETLGEDAALARVDRLLERLTSNSRLGGGR
jgi:colanic acid biosynthesis glycosyl transferase WcaI